MCDPLKPAIPTPGLQLTSYPAKTVRLAGIALQAAGLDREPTPEELAVVDGWRHLGATLSRVRFVVRHLVALGGFELVSSAPAVATRLQAYRKWPGAM